MSVKEDCASQLTEELAQDQLLAGHLFGFECCTLPICCDGRIFACFFFSTLAVVFEQSVG